MHPLTESNQPYQTSNGFENPNIQNNNDSSIDLEEVFRSIVRRKKIVITTALLAFTLGSINLAYKRIFKPIYQGEFSLLINNPIGGKEGSPNSTLSLISSVAKNDVSTDIPTLIEFLKSPIILSEISEKYGIGVKGLGNDISIKLGGGKKIAYGVLEVTYQSRNIKQLGDVLDDLTKTYLNAARNENQKKLTEGLEFLNLQDPILRKKQAELEDKLSKFRAENQLIDPIVEGSNVLDEISGSDERLKILKENKEKLLNLKKEVKKGNFSAIAFTQNIKTGAKSNGPGIVLTTADAARLQEITDIEKQLSQSRLKYKPTSLMITAFEKKLISLKPELIDLQMNTIDKALTLNENETNSTNLLKEKVLIEFKDKPNLIRDYKNIRQLLEISRKNLAALINAKERFQLQLAQESTPWQVLSVPEVSQTPFRPKVRRTLLLYFLGSGVFGISIGLIRDRLDKQFHHSKDIEEKLKSPILGNVPYLNIFKDLREAKGSVLDKLKSLDELIPEESNDKETSKNKQYEKFIYQESFRNIYTSLRFIDVDKPLKTLIITSSIPKEGKSLINILLAKTLADIGLKVLLIDADLRKPQIHIRLGLNNIVGFSNLLVEKDKELKSLTQKVKGVKNLDILSSGRSVPDTTRLLRSQRLKDIIKGIEEQNYYDYVLFDTPPILGLSDASLISNYCDGIILIVTKNFVNKSLPQESVKRISITSNLIGLITNDKKEISVTDKAGKSVVGAYGYEEYAAIGYFDEEKLNKSETKETKDSLLKIYISKLERLKDKFIAWIDQ